MRNSEPGQVAESEYRASFRLRIGVEYLAPLVLVFCMLADGASAADDAVRKADADKELSRRVLEDRDCCVKKPPEFSSRKPREPDALDKDPEGWRVQGPERYPEAIGVEHCQIQRGHLSQMVVELRAGTRPGASAWSKDQVKRARRLIAKKEEIEKRCCANLDRCEREARDAWRTKPGGNRSN